MNYNVYVGFMHSQLDLLDTAKTLCVGNEGTVLYVMAGKHGARSRTLGCQFLSSEQAGKFIGMVLERQLDVEAVPSG